MYLGIDLGTSGVKVVLMDEAQRIVQAATAPLEVMRPESGWSEQNADDWITATDAAMSELARDHSMQIAAVRGIGLSGQMHGATLVGADDKALRPCLLWNDTRAHVEATEMDANPDFRAISGNIVFPGFTAPKTEWMRRHEPDVFGKMRKVLLPKDYLRLWLTGDAVSEMSDAAGTSWLDVEKRDWSDTLLSACSLDRGHMPRLVEGTEVSGTLRAELASKWGMGKEVVVAGGAGDNAASAVGMGTIAEGAAFASLGTSGVLFAANDAYRPNAESAVHTFCHALPGTWHQMGVILSATDSMNWLANLTGKNASELSHAAGETLSAPGPVLFLPYLGGERTPHNDAAIRGALIGLEHASGAGALAKAVMEGVAFAFRDCLDALRAAGTELESMTAVGGGSRSKLWLKMLATALNRPVEIAADGYYGAGYGAARLAMIAAENADPSSVCTRPETVAVIEPQPSLVEAFEAAHQRYRAAYAAIKPI